MITSLYLKAKVAQNIHLIETHLNLDSPFDFEVDEKTMAQIFADLTPDNFAQQVEEHPALVDILESFSNYYCFVPVDEVEFYDHVKSGAKKEALFEALRWEEIEIKLREGESLILIPYACTDTFDNPMTANLDSEIQRLFDDVIEQEDSKRKRAIIHNLRQYFGDALKNPLWEGNHLKFELNEFHFIHYGQ